MTPCYANRQLGRCGVFVSSYAPRRCGVRAGAHLHHSGVERIQRNDLAKQRRLLVRALRVLADLGEVDHVCDDE